MSEDDAVEGREIADLLPFYAAGTLRGMDKARVGVALAADPALQRELGLVAEEQSATIEVNEALGAPSREASQRFFRLLETQAPQGAHSRFDVAGWLAARLDSLRPGVLAWAAIAASVVLLVQAGVIGTMLSSGPAQYQTASVEPSGEADKGTMLLVSFEPNAKAADISKALDVAGASIAAGPLPGGLYRLKVSDAVLDSASVSKITERLKASGVIHYAAPAGNSSD